MRFRVFYIYKYNDSKYLGTDNVTANNVEEVLELYKEIYFLTDENGKILVDNRKDY